MSDKTIDEIIIENEAGLVRYAGRLLGDHESARDMVQEAFVRLVAQMDGEKERIENVKAWLYRTTRNLCYDFFKSARNRFESVSDPESIAHIADYSLAPDIELERRDDMERVREQINALDPRSREILMLKIEHGRSYREIAEIMDITVTNVGFILHKAVRKIAAGFSGEDEKIEIKQPEVSK